MMTIDTTVLDNYMMMKMMMTHRSLIFKYTTPTINHMIIIWYSEYHQMIIIWTYNNHLMIIAWSTYSTCFFLFVCLFPLLFVCLFVCLFVWWSSDNQLMIIRLSFNGHHICINLPEFVPIYTYVHQFTRICFNLHEFIPIYRNLHQFTPICINVPQFASICTNLHQFIPICTNLPKYASICTN